MSGKLAGVGSNVFECAGKAKSNLGRHVITQLSGKIL